MGSWLARRTGCPLLGGILVGSLLLAIGCGDSPAQHRTPTYAPSNAPACGTCDSSDTDTTSGLPKDLGDAGELRVEPTMLTFFRDADENHPEAVGLVTVKNSTANGAVIEAVEIRSRGTGETSESTTYFEAQLYGIDAHELPSQSTSLIVVTFAGSMEQQSAELVILTSHPDYRELVVDLEGKYFIPN